jgi:prevent-host-death family protein
LAWAEALQAAVGDDRLGTWSFHLAAGSWITTVVDPPAAKFHLRRVWPGGFRANSLTGTGSLTRIKVMSVQSLATVKAHFSQVIDEVAGTHERVTVTKNGSPVAVILAVEDYESLMETLEILSDPRAGTEIRRSEEEMAAGKVYDEADVRAALAARRR